MKLHLALLPVLLFPSALQAATYVVDNQNPAAADTNAGSEVAPFKTVQHAADIAHAGDTVFVCEGKYPEYVTLKNPGTDAAWITFKSAPRRTAQLVGLDAGSSRFVRIEGFHMFRDTDKDGPKSKGGIKLANADDIDIVDNFIENAAAGITGGRTLKNDTKSHSPSHIRIQHNDIYHCNYGVLAAGQNWLLESNEIHRLFNYGSDDADYSRAFGDAIEYRYNFFHGTKNNEIAKAHVDIVQFFDNNGEYLSNLHVHHNVFTDFHQGLMGEMHHPGNVSNLTFDHNVYYTAEPWGAWGIDNEDIPNVIVQQNTFYGIAWFGVGIKGQGATGGVIRNNIFDKIDQAVQITKDKKKNQTVIDHNLLFQINHKDVHGESDLLNTDPRMIDPAHDNFRLAADSPALKSGADHQTIGALDNPNTWYVDPQHPAATDDSFGYAGHPFKTLSKALASAKSGDTIVLQPGVYREVLKPAVDNLTIEAENNTVTFSGADLLENWKKAGKAWSADLDRKPAALLRDGVAFTAFTYDPAGKTLTLTDASDPRLHSYEIPARQNAIDLTHTAHTTLISLQSAHTLGPAVLEGQNNKIIFAPPAPSAK